MSEGYQVPNLLLVGEIRSDRFVPIVVALEERSRTITFTFDSSVTIADTITFKGAGVYIIQISADSVAGFEDSLVGCVEGLSFL
jgi:hypothetical protein